MLTLSLHAQTFAGSAVGHVLNSLPESVFIALFAWGVLQLRPGQNSRTRFAVWFIALLAAAVVPFFAGLGHISTFISARVSTHASSTEAPLHLPVRLAGVLFLIWLVVAAALTVRLCVGLWRVYKLRQTCSPVHPEDLDPELRQLLAKMNSGVSRARQVTLATSDRVRVPAAIGIWKPMIVLPAWLLSELSPADLAIVLHHEFAHLRHWDDWTNLIQKFVRAVFFFHPAVWWIESQLSVEREMACDDFVLAQTANPAGYASCLVSLLEKSLAERGWTMAQAIVHRARETSLRLARILDSRRPTATRISKSALGLIGTATALCLFLLPSAPPVVSFEQSSRSSEPYVAAASPSPIPPAMVHRADFAISARPAIVPASMQHMSENSLDRKQKSNSSASTPVLTARASSAASPLTVRLSRDESMAESTMNEPRMNEPRLTEPRVTESAFLASLTDALLQQSQLLNLRYSPDVQNPMPAVFVIRAADLIETDSQFAPVEWRVVIWRVTVVHAMGNAKASAPVPHST
jgi:beta-lactamase regulating signal transducer with metallopeptidase domain